MGIISSVIGNSFTDNSVCFEAFLEIKKELKDGFYEVRYRYPDEKINTCQMKYDEIVKLVKKLNVDIVDNIK
jgi:hypothetical protein